MRTARRFYLGDMTAALRYTPAPFLWSVLLGASGIATAYDGSNEKARSEFERLAKAANVVRALRGDEPTFRSNDMRIYNLPEGSLPGSHSRIVYDHSVGGLRFDIPAGSAGANIAGSFFFNFGRDFGPNQRFRVRWQQMWNEAFRTVDVGNTAIKLAIVGSGDSPGRRPQPSCTTPDVVVTTFFAFRMTQLYFGCGRYWPLTSGPTTAFQNKQASVNGKWCDYVGMTAQRNKGEVVAPPAACAAWAPAMQWQDYAIDIENGPEAGAQYAYSIVRLYVGKNADGSLHLAHEWDSRIHHAGAAWNGKGFFIGDAATGERYYGKFWGLPYMTGSTKVWPALLQTWYRHFIVTDETRTPSSQPPKAGQGETRNRS